MDKSGSDFQCSWISIQPALSDRTQHNIFKLRKMGDAGVNPLPSHVVQFISESKVNEAHEWASRGQQQLYDISDTERTTFKFSVDFIDHFAEVDVAICPDWTTSSYPLFDPLVRYRPCCNFADQDDRADEKFQSDIQLVYDTYIRPTKRKFDEGWYDQACLPLC